MKLKDADGYKGGPFSRAHTKITNITSSGFFASCRDLQEEYERLKSIRDQSGPILDSDASPGGPQNRDSELLAEAKLLRQHKGRLEARMQVLEDHNRQLEAQLQRLRQLLDQVKFCNQLGTFIFVTGKRTNTNENERKFQSNCFSRALPPTCR